MPRAPHNADGIAAIDTSSRPADRAVTADLLRRYDRPAPRYTSYPTAVEFGDEMTAELYAERLAAANELGDAPLSVYVHLPFCEQRCLFCGCHVIVSPLKGNVRSYLDLLAREIELVAGHLPDRRGMAQLHLGGGTPTYHAPDELDRMLGHLLGLFTPVPGAELAVEVDPRVTTAEHIETLAARGFNRVSLGVQDFTPQVQQAIGRIQSVEQTTELIDVARRAGFGGINVDLIYGLPHQSLPSFEDTIERVIALGVDRIALYSFAFVPWIRAHMNKLEESDFPDRELKFELFGMARERLLAAGYEPIGMDHFARPEDELAVARREHRLRRNFQGYTVIPAQDVVGLGISAIGDVRGAYVQNAKKLSDYGDAVLAGRLPVERGIRRDADDELRRAVIHELMCNFRVDVPAVEAQFGVRLPQALGPELERLAAHEQERLVRITPERIEATPEGELFVRNLALCFDRYYWEKHAGDDQQVFSRSV